MKYKFDIQKDGGVEPVNWDKINLPRSGPTRYPGEPQPDQEAKCLEAYKNGDSRPLKDYLDELKARVPIVTETNGVKTLDYGVLPIPPVTSLPCPVLDAALDHIAEDAAQRLQEPVGPTPKFNPTSKAWEMPESPG